MSEGQKNNTKNDSSGVRAANAVSRSIIDLIDSRIERFVALKKQNKSVSQKEEEKEDEEPKEEEKVKAVVPKKKRENTEADAAPPQKEEKTKKPKIKEEGWVCEGNLLEKTPCPLTEDKQIVSTDTRHLKKLHNTCKYCKGVMKKARKQQNKKDE